MTAGNTDNLVSDITPCPLCFTSFFSFETALEHIKQCPDGCTDAEYGPTPKDDCRPRPEFVVGRDDKITSDVQSTIIFLDDVILSSSLNDDAPVPILRKRHDVRCDPRYALRRRKRRNKSKRVAESNQRHQRLLNIQRQRFALCDHNENFSEGNEATVIDGEIFLDPMDDIDADADIGEDFQGDVFFDSTDNESICANAPSTKSRASSISRRCGGRRRRSLEKSCSSGTNNRKKSSCFPRAWRTSSYGRSGSRPRRLRKIISKKDRDQIRDDFDKECESLSTILSYPGAFVYHDVRWRYERLRGVINSIVKVSPKFAEELDCILRMTQEERSIRTSQMTVQEEPTNSRSGRSTKFIHHQSTMMTSFCQAFILIVAIITFKLIPTVEATFPIASGVSMPSMLTGAAAISIAAASGFGSQGNDIDSMAAQVEGKLTELEEDANRSIDIQLQIRNDIETVLKDHLHDDHFQSSVYAKVLGVPDKGIVGVDDVMLKLRYNAFVTWMSRKEDITQEALYRSRLNDLVQSTWDLAWRLEYGPNVSHKTLSERAGMIFFGLRNDTRRNRVVYEDVTGGSQSLRYYRKFGDFLDCMRRLICSIRVQSSGRKLVNRPATSTVVKKFIVDECPALVSDVCYNDNVTDDMDVSTAVGDAGSDGGLSNESGQSSETVQGGNEKESYAEELLAEKPPDDVIDKFLDQVGRCALLDSSDNLVMTDRDKWIELGNSDLYGRLLSQHFRNLIHPNDGQHQKPKTLDVLAGVTHGNYTCMTTSGPSFKVHKQVFPSSHDEPWALLLPVFENHLSLEFLRKAKSGIDEVPFGKYNGRFLRLASTWASQKKPTLLTWGNSPDRLLLHRATNISRDHERDVLKITNWILAQLDIVMRSCIKLLQDRIKSTTVSSSMNDSPATSAEESSSFPAAPANQKSLETNPTTSPTLYSFPIANVGEPPKDRNDFLAILAGIRAFYSRHSDTSPEKHCIHDDNEPHGHHSMMRICTTSIGCDAFGSHKTQPDHKGGLLTICHLVPGQGDDLTYFEYEGHFEDGTFHKKNKSEKKITVFSDVHLHIQLWGSQGVVQHEIECKVKSKARVVFSARCTEPYWLSKERREEVFRPLGRQPKISDLSHDTKNVWSNISGVSHAKQMPADEVQNFLVEECVASSQQTGQDSFEVNHFSNNKVLTIHDKVDRQCVIGVPPSLSVEIAARSAQAATAFHANQCGVKLSRSNGPVVNAGVWVDDWTDPCMPKPVIPGDHIDDTLLSHEFNLKKTSHKEEIFDPDRVDALNLLRPGKNSAALLSTLIRVLNGESLQNIKIRSIGGAFIKAGTHQMESSSRNSYREARTHTCALSQDPGSPFAIAMKTACYEKRCIHVFFKGVYLGLYQCVKSEQKELDDDEYDKECREMDSHIETLKSMDKAAGLLSGISTDEIEDERMSMLATSCWFELRPVFPNSPTEFSSTENEKWDVIEMERDEFEWPAIRVPKDKLGTLKRKYCTPSRILDHDLEGFHFLKDSARTRLTEEGYIILPNEINSEDCVLMSNTESPKTLDQIINLAIHSGAAILYRMFGNCVSDDNKMIPPREMLGEEYADLDSTNGKAIDEYGKVLHDTNTKVLMVRPPHSPLLMHEPGVAALMELTNGSDSKYRELDGSGCWMLRNGPKFVLEDNESFDMIFQAFICSMQCPSSLVKNKAVLEFFAPKPSGQELKEYIAYIERHKWGKGNFLHPIFENLFRSTRQYVQFVTQFAEDGKVMIRDCIEGATDGDGYTDRRLVLQRLRRRIIKRYHLVVTEFQVQVLMRTVETCIHEPFGDPDKSVVACGWGSRDAAKCFIDTFKDRWGKEQWEHSVKSSRKMTKDDIISRIPLVVLDHFNNWAKPVSNAPAHNALIDHSLKAIGLKWSEELDCLVHIYGIGKKLCVCDAEHMLCMFNTTFQHTLPSWNRSLNPLIHGSKYYPIRCSSVSGLVNEMSFMDPYRDRYLEVIEAYRALIKDDTFCFSKLDPIFRIDFEGYVSKTGSKRKCEEIEKDYYSSVPQTRSKSNTRSKRI